MRKLGVILSLLLCLSGPLWAPISNRLNIAEQDGIPSLFPYKLKVTNGSLTDNGDGTASLATGGGTAGGSLYSVQSNNPLGTLAGDSLFQYNGTSITFSAAGPLGVTYGVTAGSVTVNGTGPGEIDMTEGTLCAAGIANKDVLCTDSSTHQLKLSNNNGAFVALGSGGGSPGGSNTQIQYNNAGAFGGVAPMIYQSTGITISTPTVYTGITTFLLSKNAYLTIQDTATFNAYTAVNSSFSVVATTVTAYSVTIGTTSASSWHVAVSTNGHVVTNAPAAAAPTVSSCGTNASIAGNDNAGTITVGTGGTTTCVLTFGKSWAVSPWCVFGSSNSYAGVSTRSATSVTVTFGASLAGSNKVDYRCGCAGSTCQ